MKRSSILMMVGIVALAGTARAELDACPGQDVSIAGDSSMVLGPYDTSTATDDVLSYGGNCTHLNVGGRDHIFHVVPEASGTLSLRTGFDAAQGDEAFCNEGTCWSDFMCPPGCWTKILYVRSTCSASTPAEAAVTEIACNWDPTFTKYVTADLSIQVTAGADYFVVVDAPNNNANGFAAGPYYLEASLTTP